MMYGIFDSETKERLGTVMRFAGEPPATRWQAWSTVDHSKRGFRSLREAKEWLVSMRGNKETS